MALCQNDNDIVPKWYYIVAALLPRLNATEVSMDREAVPIVTGLEDIGAIFGRSRWTIARWVKSHGFPAARLPNGEYCTTPGLIDGWIMARRNVEQKRNHA